MKVTKAYIDKLIEEFKTNEIISDGTMFGWDYQSNKPRLTDTKVIKKRYKKAKKRFINFEGKEYKKIRRAFWNNVFIR